MELWQFVAPDLGNAGHLDLYEFLGDDDAQLVACFSSGAEALSHPQLRLGASGERWVNQFVVQDDYRDFVLSGRPHGWAQMSV